jgi:tRNA(Ile)-lysidine synthase
MYAQNIKISDFFINQHLPLVIRNKYPLICSGDEIVWVPGMRLGEKGKVSSKTCILCHIQLVKNG